MLDFENTLCCELLSCGYLDLESAEELLKGYNFLNTGDVIDKTKEIYWEINNINQIIYTIYDMVVQEFESDINKTLEDWSDYEIYANYMDHSLYFTTDKLQNKFDKWLKQKAGL